MQIPCSRLIYSMRLSVCSYEINIAMSFSDYIVSRSLPIWFFIYLIFLVLLGKSQKEVLQVKVGVVLDTNLTLADLSLRAINMSLSEFYNTHNRFKTRIVLDIRNSKGTVVGAAASGKYCVVKLHLSRSRMKYIVNILSIRSYLSLLCILYTIFILLYIILYYQN